MIVDSLTFLGDGLFGRHADAPSLLAALDAAGIDRAVVAPLKPRDYAFGPANKAIAETVKQHADRLIGFARVDPWQGPQARQELEHAVHELGLRGLFVHPWEECFQVTSGVLDPLLEFANQEHLPVTIATGFPSLSEALQVGHVAGRFPDVPIIATHGGQINISGLGTFDADLALGRYSNLAIQTTGVYREDFLESMVQKHGAHRVLFASCYPLFDPRFEVLRGKWAHLDEGARSAILGGNAKRLLGGE
jgi:predicted TIM-barrel fold metal-dependent hydrolase